MVLRILTWLVSLGVHAAFGLAMYLGPAGGAALEQGTGDDIMVVEKGIAIQGFAKLGEDVMSVEAVEAPPMMMAAAQPLERVEAVEEQQEELPLEDVPEVETVEEQQELPVEDVPEVQPVEEQQVLTSEAGPEQENVIEPQEIEEIQPQEKVTEVQKRMLEEPEPEKIEQLLPQQAPSVPQETVIAMRESSGEEMLGGDATAHRAYLGKLRTHLEDKKVNPRTTLVGTTIVRLTVKSDGVLVAHRIVKSSGSKKLDEAAVASIRRASPFPPIPAEVGRDTVEVSVPYRFTVRRR